MKKLELATDDEDLWFDEEKWGMGESDLTVNCQSHHANSV
jgi:hypothetical protein